jgi:hypothetical protein
MGSSIVIYFDDGNRLAFQESSYPVDTIKKLIKRLKEINPSVKLHRQYEKLIKDEIEDERRFRQLAIEN